MRMRMRCGWSAGTCGSGWLAGWDAAVLIVAVNEAVTNSVEHTYRGRERGTVRVRAEVSTDAALDRGRVTVVVSDQGRWRDPPMSPRHTPRGIALMHALAQTLAEDTVTDNAQR